MTRFKSLKHSAGQVKNFFAISKTVIECHERRCSLWLRYDGRVNSLSHHIVSQQDCELRRFDLFTASLHQAIVSTCYVSVYVAPW